MRADARAWQGRVSRGGALSATIPTRLTEARGCPHPIISAGMGGPARSELAAAGDTLWGYHPDQLPRDVIGDDDGRPVYRCGTDSPLRSTTGDFEQMCLYAGKSSAHVTGIHPAAAIIDAMMRDATAALRGADARAARL